MTETTYSTTRSPVSSPLCDPAWSRWARPDPSNGWGTIESVATQEEFEAAARQLRGWAGKLDAAATSVSGVNDGSAAVGGSVAVAIDEAMGLILNNLMAAADELEPLAAECDVRAARCEQHQKDLATWESDLSEWESDMTAFKVAQDHPSVPGMAVAWPGDAPPRPVAPPWVDPQ